MDIIFRHLQPSDALAYRKTRLECLRSFPDNFGSTYEEESKKTELKFEQIIKKGDKDCFMMGAFDGEQLIGLCGFHSEGRLKTKHRGDIVQMYVKPDYAGKHVGPALLRKAIEKAFLKPEIELVTLGVVNENARAIKVYERIGFREYGRIPHFFKSGTTYLGQRFMILDRETFRP